MTEKANGSLIIALDIRQNRIRIHKTVMQSLGFPKYIQLLVNPNKKHIAIRGVDVAVPGDQTERIKPQELMAGDCYELHSKSLLWKLFRFVGSPDPSYTYRLTGNFVSEFNLVVFPTSTLTKYEV